MTILTQRMTPASKVCLSISAIAALAFADLAEAQDADGAALCGGRRYAISATLSSLTPAIELSADGVAGPFLLDTGATRSSLSESAFAGPDGSVRKAAISLPGFNEGDFVLARYDPQSTRLGVIGTDFLSLFTLQLTGNAAFLGVQACQPDALGAEGLVPVAQDGFFSADPSKIEAGRSNVPVVFFRLGEVRTWAQIDTGYADSVYPHSVDINQALYARLAKSGMTLQRSADVSVETCEGRESRRAYSVKEVPLVIENEQGKPIVQTGSFHLIVKPANGCGGIGAMTVPAAQLGASFLELFGTAVFDPKSTTVWLGKNTRF